MDTGFSRLLAYLLALELHAKNGHYIVKGSDFLSKHEAYDMIISEWGELSDWRDSIQEVVYLGKGLEAIPSKALMTEALGLLPDSPTSEKVQLDTTKILMDQILANCEDIGKQQITQGEADLLGQIADGLQHKMMILERMSK
jgi:DNA-binding ferritin-like protein